MYHGEKKPYTPRRHTLEVPFYGEGDLLGDSEVEGACGGSYIAVDHGRLGGYIGSQRSERSEQLVVMRKLNLSERRDSFKKQEAVQEVSFDEPEEKTSPSVTMTTTLGGAQTQLEHQPLPPPQHRTVWMLTRPQSSQEVELEVPVVRRFTLVPQIAVQGSTESEQDEWEPCSDGDDTNENLEVEAEVESTQQQQPSRRLCVDGGATPAEATYTGPHVVPATEKESREGMPMKGHHRK